MDFQSTIRAFQNDLVKWRFPPPSSFSEGFAFERYRKKMEKPDHERVTELTEACFNEFISFDQDLPDQLTHPSGEWYQARILLHSWIRGSWKRSPVDFPTGSSFHPTKGLNSVESRLARGKWSCTPENFELFSELVYNHKALKRAFRKRYNSWYRKRDFRESQSWSDRYLWSRLGCPRKIFEWKLRQITSFVRGSRFATVPKDNRRRRPINLEAFGNILTQRQQGVFLRDCLFKSLGLDLRTLQHVHKARIRNTGVATIDLKNASDSVSLALCRFLLPRVFMADLEQTRSSLLFGLDCDYHVPKKISSMGNGFTFELMTLILTAICRTLDPEATVYGDDIIIAKDRAPRLIELLSEVGFVVNTEKSFIEGPFRESCGANYHDDEGYVKSFDFLWPETIADCALIFNKTKILAQCYTGFLPLLKRLRRHIPRALQGGPLSDDLVSSLEEFSWDSEERLATYFACDSKGSRSKRTDRLSRELCYPVNDVGLVPILVFRPQKASQTMTDLSAAWHWGKYEMYLHSGRRADDTVTGSGRWSLKHSLRVGDFVYT